MSLPTTGLFTAKVASWKLSFDGEAWTGEGERFNELVGPALARETPRHQGNHLTVDVVGPRVLESLFPGQWKELSAQVDAWEEELDREAVD